jgi:hypothetical protein
MTSMCSSCYTVPALGTTATPSELARWLMESGKVEDDKCPGWVLRDATHWDDLVLRLGYLHPDEQSITDAGTRSALTSRPGGPQMVPGSLRSS